MMLYWTTGEQSYLLGVSKAKESKIITTFLDFVRNFPVEASETGAIVSTGIPEFY